MELEVSFSYFSTSSVSYLLLLSFLSLRLLLPAPSPGLPLPDLLGLIAFVDALLVDAETHAAHQSEDHHHDGAHCPHGH